MTDDDWILTASCDWKKVDEIFFTGELETVYNLRVADDHTYFVGDTDWDWSVWTHNAQFSLVNIDGVHFLVDASTRRVIKEVYYFDDVTKHLVATGDNLVGNKYTKTQHTMTYGRGKNKETIQRDVYENNIDFDGGLPKFVDRDSVHPTVLGKLDNGYSNRQLMAEGYAPIAADGKPVNLHHITGSEPGAMIELMQSTHQKHTQILHNLIEDGKSFRHNSSLEYRYTRFAEKWWMDRSKDFTGV